MTSRRKLLQAGAALTGAAALGFPAIVRSQSDSIRIGHLTPLTGFLGAILGGLGTEHGIHLLTGYTHARGTSASGERAVASVFAPIGKSAVISALVGGLTFLTLALSEFRAFREFGFIAAVGMMLLVASNLIVLPALLGLCERAGWRRKPNIKAQLLGLPPSTRSLRRPTHTPPSPRHYEGTVARPPRPASSMFCLRSPGSVPALCVPVLKPKRESPRPCRKR